jgi:hypothetical protein
VTVSGRGRLDALLNVIGALTDTKFDDPKIREAGFDEGILADDFFDFFAARTDGQNDAAIPWNLASRHEEIPRCVVFPEELQVRGHVPVDLGKTRFVDQLDDEHAVDRTAMRRYPGTS